MDLRETLEKLVVLPQEHGRLLNTLSFLENCGARMIASCEHPRLVREEMLKHAAEEFRHAHHLKKQIKKVTDHPFENYSPSLLLGGMFSWNYLKRLETQLIREIKRRGLGKEMCYFLVTYAIEMRAGTFYPVYHEVLKKAHSRVSVRSILLEEEEHLAEMEKALEVIPYHEDLKRWACRMENSLYENLLNHLN